MAEQSDVSGPDLTRGIALADLQQDSPLVGHVGDDAVVVVRRGEEVFAIGARCSHYGGPLEKGLVVGDSIHCPWHHGAFSLRTGASISAPALRGTGCYPVTLSGGTVRVGPRKDTPRPESRGAALQTIVMVGAGAAAAAASELLRHEGYRGTIIMIGAEETGPVDRPNLSKDYLAGKAPEAWIPLGGDERWEELNVQLLKGVEVDAIDRGARKVRTSDGQEFAYDALLFATGAEPVLPPMEGLATVHHFTLRSLQDASRIIEAAEAGKRALVVGAGFIGLEVAASLRKRELDVTVVAPEKVPLEKILGRELGRLVQKTHETHGVTFHLGHTVERFAGGKALLSDGNDLDFDFVVLGTGVRPRVALAEKAGLKVDDGVVVDENLRTSDPAILAVGDVARFPEPSSNAPARVEHWVLAQRLAQRAARVMLDLPVEPLLLVPFFWSRHFDLNLKYVGHSTDYDDVVIRGDLQERDATVGYLKKGRVEAVVTLGRARESLRAEQAFAVNDQATLRALLRLD
ncbi:pyridine nucleotide-disulfide oxidoreductase [Bradymonadaceae bacterium TMQ3]|uniref:Pyridine nucleotide-disulfide oxidoreductase n=1 Tax=Lujinxingia sediminis TaxID=2480984 RepID=A0ABY0CQH5_9DELT|nr:FAD-dependent oxidoreductase [Lujinxingia sediminis]RDV37920.1 pyridine nucleotide-disulfide oxidoreductase [Bradymonadaceae bacterium TMQ3]RVU42751.1 pyridine nucleotide-disulfide oxidoreductase [Lujinxingia sediminis]TXC75301.1 Rieske 2Fe-2S domain-containing protein [Bradymonadales bacterium TMQ1]